MLTGELTGLRAIEEEDLPELLSWRNDPRMRRYFREYRELNMKDKVKSLPESELLDLLAGNGRLIKRPIVTDGERVTIGYKEEIFDETWC